MCFDLLCFNMSLWAECNVNQMACCCEGPPNHPLPEMSR